MYAHRDAGKGKSLILYVDELIYQHFKSLSNTSHRYIPVDTEGILDHVESVISDPVCLQAFIAAIHCVFHHLATQGVEILLG